MGLERGALELAHVLLPTELRTTEFAPATGETTQAHAPQQGYGKPVVALPRISWPFLGAGLRPPA